MSTAVWSANASGVADQVVGAFQNPSLLLGIPLALAGAVFMSLGAQYQHRGVEKVERLSGSDAATGLSGEQVRRLLTRPSWIIGTLMLGLAVICQLSAMSIAPLTVVQPLGAIALVMTTLLNARVSGHTPTKQSLVAIGCCIGGVFVFVFFAAIFATEREITERELLVILAVLLVVIILLGGCWLLLRRRMKALFYVAGAGVLYGFVATLAKTIITRFQEGAFDWITVVCGIALLAAAGAGGYFVQCAYASGPPDLVIAGLTVIDPLVAVLIAMLVLGEAAAAPTWVLIVFVLAGAVAVWGVIQLARYHPQVLSESQELGIMRGSGGSEKADSAPQSAAAAQPDGGTATPPAPPTGRIVTGPWAGSGQPTPPPQGPQNDAPGTANGTGQ